MRKRWMNNRHTPKIHNIDDEDGALLHCIMTQTKQYEKGLERFAVKFQSSSTLVSIWSKLICYQKGISLNP
ncbi:hypothetical protein RclHR1_02920004 [Rhizophagus clarus]|nr:hypothetical protein RclHR1_02920004 [Rhizophagus clarus]